jgi:hypothetical protein
MRKKLTLGDFRTTVRLFNDNIPTYARHVSKLRDNYKVRGKKQTFWSKRNTDSVCKHVNTFKNARAALVGKPNFFVSAASENSAGSLCRSTTERARGAGGDVVHGVRM